jgi:hypothetical protein
MIRRLSQILTLSLSVSGIGCDSIAQGEPELITVSLSVAVLDPAGLPLSDTPLVVGGRATTTFVTTNAGGTASTPFQRLESEEEFYVSLTDLDLVDRVLLNVPEQAATDANARYQTLLSQYAFRADYAVPVAPMEADASLIIHAVESVHVSGRLVTNSGQVVSAAILTAIGWESYTQLVPADDGLFTLTGVPADTKVRMLIGTQSEMTIVELSEEQTSGNVALGDLLIFSHPRVANAHITVTNRDSLVGAMGQVLSDEVTLISADGTVIIPLRVDGLGKVANYDSIGNAAGPVPIPAGTFYLSPGVIGHRTPLALYESVRAGRQAALDAAGVPTMSVAIGGTATLEFDARAARTAILSVGSDLVD